jgi:hypothetical protein
MVVFDGLRLSHSHLFDIHGNSMGIVDDIRRFVGDLKDSREWVIEFWGEIWSDRELRTLHEAKDKAIRNRLWDDKKQRSSVEVDDLLEHSNSRQVCPAIAMVRENLDTFKRFQASELPDYLTVNL